MSSRMNAGREAPIDLSCVVDANPAIDWRAIALNDPGTADALVWCDLEPKVMTPLLKAYQRLVRLVPVGEERRALVLLEHGFQSAIQIASLARDEFASRWDAMFPGEAELGAAVHRAAISRRGALLLHHINHVQHNEPHYRAARFK